jgi:YD repeat-containing protein
VLWLLAAPAASRAGSSPVDPATSFSPLGSGLVISGAPNEGEQLGAASEAERRSPQAVAGRAASRTIYAGLDSGRAAKLASAAFPAFIDRPAGGQPQLPAGESIAGYPTDNAATVNLGGGRRAVIESLQPVATESVPGHRAPIELALSKRGGFFQPARALVGVRIPKRLSQGAALTASGVSLVPVDSHHHPLEGSEGQVDGSAVFYSGAERDTDAAIKPTTYGFEEVTLLRSVDSPQHIYFRVGLPAGASLKRRTGLSAAEVVAQGRPVARIPQPTALDAAGTPVPVTMSVSGELLSLRVDHRGGDYRYPIEIDPAFVSDEQLTSREGGRLSTHWKPLTEGNFCVTEEPLYLPEPYFDLRTCGEYGRGGKERADIIYDAEGNSVITSALLTAEGSNFGGVLTTMRLLGSNGLEGEHILAYGKSALSRGGYQVCYGYSAEKCNPQSKPPWEYQAQLNYVDLDMAPTERSTTEPNWTRVYAASVEIQQPTAPEAHFDASTQSLWNGSAYVPNVLQTSGWLGPNSGAYQVKFNDSGVGVGRFAVGLLPPHARPEVLAYRNLWSEKKCEGVQCPGEINETYTWNPKLPEGEDTIYAGVFNAFEGTEVTGGELLLSENEPSAKLKVDGQPPHNITLTGAIKGGEISAGESKFAVAATDGELGTATPSSGIRSITVSIDGRQVGAPQGYCPSGPCTGSGVWTIYGRNYSPGRHSLIVTAVDNANNIAREEFSVVIHSASRLSAGPGQLDAESGGFGLTATDVSLGSGLGFSRSYDSTRPAAGAGGSLGPQWQASLGGLQTLSELPEGNVAMNSPSGGQAIFALGEKGEYESPQGDGNLKLEGKRSGNSITEFLLSDSSAGTTTRFTQPGGFVSAPAYLRQLGSSGQFSQPTSVATDANGNLWVADTANNRVEQVNAQGAVTPIGGPKQFATPWGIAVSQTSGKVYVTDQGNHRVQELSPTGEFIRSFAMPSEKSPQFGTLKGIAVDSIGNVWVCDSSNNVVDEFSAEGEYKETVSGTGTEALKGPTGVAFSGPDLYVVDSGNNRVALFEVFANGSRFAGAFGGTGEGPGEFKEPLAIARDPASGNLYVTDAGNARVQEFKGSTFLATFGTRGSAAGEFSGPSGIAVSPQGGLYVVDPANNVLQEWEPSRAKSTWLPTVSEGTVPTATQTYAYRTAEVEGKQVIEPTEELAPKPAGVSCEAEGKPKLERGCRALLFKFGTQTKAGENASEWGEYNGRLARVEYGAWNPKSGRVEEVPVAEYAYDAQGRLRIEWDPRIAASTACGGPCPALKTIYGYDSEGHVTALTPPGQQPWIFTYGTIAGDTSPGRLIKWMRPLATTPLQSGAVPTKTAAPALEGTAEVGVRMAVSEGGWSPTPSTYAYQWLDCNSSGEGCTPIGGATNPNYTPVAGDLGHTLRAQVTASASGGSASATSAQSQVIVPREGSPSEAKALQPQSGSTVEYNVPVSGSGAPYAMGKSDVSKWAQSQEEAPAQAVAIFPPDESQSWPATDYRRATVYYLDAKGRHVNVASPGGGISTTLYNDANEVTRTLSADNRLAVLESGKALTAEELNTTNVYNEAGTELLESIGPEHTVKLRNGSSATARSHTVYHYDEGAPEGERHGLVTKVTQGALLEWFVLNGKINGGKETDIRTTVTSYSGQSGLGWKLRKPTATTQDPGGLSLTQETIYDPTTGNVVETRNLGSSSVTEQPSGPSGPGRLATAWGLNYSGELGDGATTNRALPGAIGRLSEEPKAISAGDGHSLALLKNGAVMAWGYAGQLGNGTKEGSNLPVAVCAVGETAPCSHHLGDNVGEVVAVSAGGNFSLALLNTGRVVAWGRNFAGQLGNGTRTDSLVPVEVAGISEAVEISGGAEEGLARLKNGTVMAWGYNESGQLGDGTTTRRTTPVKVSNLSGVTAIAAGNEHSLALLENGTVMDWGANYGGQLGNGTRQQSPLPVKVSNISGVTAIAAGQSHSLALLSNHTVMAWGRNEAGELGNGTTTNSEVPIEVPGLREVAAIAANSSSMALLSNGTVMDWGNNEYGALGADRATGPETCEFQISCSKRPIPVSSLSEVTEIAAGGQHNLAFGKLFRQATQTIYYTPKAEASVAVCQNRPEWTNLVCLTKPAQQPAPQPKLGESKIEYNMWGEPEKTEESGSTTRTTITSYDPAGRTESTQVLSSVDVALSAVVRKYAPSTGALEVQTQEESEGTKTITTVYNTLGQLNSYTDADGATSSYEYDADGRVKKVSKGEEHGEAKDTQTSVYDTTTGSLIELVDSNAGVFKASYDPQGKLASETYPNGMTAISAYNPAGEATALEYVKTGSTLYRDAIVPAIHGEPLSETSSLESLNYAYDSIGRLSQVQEEPTGKGCTTRAYGYDEESNRTSLTTRKPNAKNECVSLGGTVEEHTYDEANRLTDPGVQYDQLGNMTTTPAPDAGGQEAGELKSSYYVDSQLATQEQGTTKIEYRYDPAGRTRKTMTTGGSSSTVISHYAGPEGTPSWTSEGSTLTIKVAGIDGTLAAVARGAVSTLQLHDLKGNVVATIGDNPAETKLLSEYISTEFGVPTTSKPPPYSFLGALGVSSELPSGVISQGGPSYVPQLGRRLQADPIEPPGTYPTGSLSGTPYVSQIPPAVIAQTAAFAAGAPGIEAQHQAELRKQAEAAAAAAAAESRAGGVIIVYEETTVIEQDSETTEDEGVTATEARSVTCKIGGSFARELQTIYALGWFACSQPVTSFRVAVCIRAENPGTGKWNNVSCNSAKGTVWNETTTEAFCAVGIRYEVGVYGALQFGRRHSEGKTASRFRCGNSNIEDIEQVVDYIRP